MISWAPLIQGRPSFHSAHRGTGALTRPDCPSRDKLISDANCGTPALRVEDASNSRRCAAACPLRCRAVRRRTTRHTRR